MIWAVCVTFCGGICWKQVRQQLVTDCLMQGQATRRQPPLRQARRSLRVQRDRRSRRPWHNQSKAKAKGTSLLYPQPWVQARLGTRTKSQKHRESEQTDGTTRRTGLDTLIHAQIHHPTQTIYKHTNHNTGASYNHHDCCTTTFLIFSSRPAQAKQEGMSISHHHQMINHTWRIIVS